MDCITDITIPTLLTEPCGNTYISTLCTISPEANVVLDLPVNSTQSETNAAITAALVYKEQQIQDLQAQLYSTAITITKTDIDILILSNSLVVGTLYEILGVHPTLYNDGLNSGTTIYLQALTTNTLAKSGYGKFYNPKYNQAVSGFGVWSNRSTWAATLTSGNFNGNELITANNGATGQLFSTLDNNTFIALTGDWAAATSITGNVSLATATISTTVLKSYAIGDKAIWGGYSWTNTSGLVGASTDVLNLGIGWAKDAYSVTNYNIAYDFIEYDYSNNWISRRYEVESGNDVVYTFSEFSHNSWLTYSAISVFMFGNKFDTVNSIGIGMNLVIHAYNENINFTGSYQYDLTFGTKSSQYNLIFGSNSYQGALTFRNQSSQSSLTFGSDSYQYNLTFGNNSYQENLTFGSNSFQTDLTFGLHSHQVNLTFNFMSYQSDIYFSSNSLQDAINFGYNSGQISLTFETGANQTSLIFSSGSSQRNLYFKYNSYISSVILSVDKTMRDITFESLTAIAAVDFTAATLISQLYPKTIYKRPDGVHKLRYYNNTDALVIANIID